MENPQTVGGVTENNAEARQQIIGTVSYQQKQTVKKTLA